jgi:hypothetical protein
MSIRILSITSLVALFGISPAKVVFGQTTATDGAQQLTDKNVPVGHFLFLNLTGSKIEFLRFRVHGSNTDWFHSPYYKQIDFLADRSGLLLDVPIQPPIYDFFVGIQNEKQDGYYQYSFDSGWDMRQYYLMEIAKDSDGEYHLYFLKRSGF